MLERKTLDSLSEFRPPKRGYLSVRVKNLGFVNEILTASISIEKEDVEMVFMKVTQHHLLISCSVDTDEFYLSRYAYFFLNKYLWFYHEKSFEDYYYPDFFDADRGTSKYLKIVSNSKGLTIKLKEQFRNLFKPGVSLPIIPLKNEARINIFLEPQLSDSLENDTPVIAYCILDPLNLHQIYNEEKELTLLTPFTATLNNDKRNFKSLLTYLNSNTISDDFELNSGQLNLNDICEEMWENSIYFRMKNHKDENYSRTFSERKKLQFDLWKSALPLMINERFMCYQWIYGLRYIRGKPIKKDIRFCQVAADIPQLKFFLIDKCDYYFLDLKFMVNGRLFNFATMFNMFFFAAAEKEPMTFYLLGSMADAEIVSYFSKISFRLPVLKKHYDTHLRTFVQQIAQTYGLTKR
ncbi:hypothetical protein [Pedobacter sp. Leaf250]|uniref:hypothetical protein n=1 Tax=Pedobacter sp. Leaf250 TaxID=2876559 RepID=UPI001E3317C4|nr:hypothetical protein [Pedobacter sp. Leaf250]